MSETSHDMARERFEMGNVILPIADALGMDIKSKGISLFGSSEMVLSNILEGVDLTIRPKIVDSLSHDRLEVAGVLVHVSSSLYLLMVSDQKEGGQLTLFVLDGSKMHSKTVFTVGWSRRDLYVKIEPFVQAVMMRGHYDSEWKVFPKGRKFVQGYLDARSRGRTSAEAMTEVLESV